MNNTQTINTRLYAFGTIPAPEAVRVEVTIARCIGEPLFKAFMDTKKTGESKKDMMASGSAAIGLIISRMDADELLVMLDTVFKYVTCAGQRIDINHFTGKNKEMWEVLLAALRFNFSDFLPESLFASYREEMAALQK